MFEKDKEQEPKYNPLKVLSVDACFVSNVLNMEIGLMKDEIANGGHTSPLYDLLKQNSNIYNFYNSNDNLVFPEILKNSYFSILEERIINGKKVKDYWRLVDHYRITRLCHKKEIKFGVLPSIIIELQKRFPNILTFGKFNRFFKLIEIPNELADEFYFKVYDLGLKYISNGAMRPERDVMHFAGSTLCGLSFLTADKDFIEDERIFGHNNDRAKAISQVNVDNNYIYTSSNGFSLFHDFYPKPMSVYYALKQISTNNISFAINPNLIFDGNIYHYNDLEFI
ncbi:MAG: hypothetical protein IJX26_01625 [Clostridia bacterium]|nr:hypothetical protein [Clostridia bacterium]